MREIKVRRERAITLSLLLGLSLVGLSLLLARPPVVKAATLTVTSSADAGGTCPGATCTLRQAIATAAAGDTINFAAGLTTVNLTSAELLINKNLTINGPGANLLSVQRSAAGGTPDFRIFNIASASLNVSISGLTIANGKLSGFASGGGISNNSTGTVTVTNSTISGNTAKNGGGIFNNTSAALTITNSTISGNTANGNGPGEGDGGGISIPTNCTVTLTNSTISGNSAKQGGGISINVNNTVTLTNSTISGNSARQFGGGISTPASTVNVRNTLIAVNTAATWPDFSGALTSQGYNLIGNTSGTTITGSTTGNQLNVNPGLGPLQNNGGPTFTHALLSGSTAIEGGNSSGSNTDQRGLARPVDSPVINNATGRRRQRHRRLRSAGRPATRLQHHQSDRQQQQ